MSQKLLFSVGEASIPEHSVSNGAAPKDFISQMPSLRKQVLDDGSKREKRSAAELEHAATARWGHARLCSRCRFSEGVHWGQGVPQRLQPSILRMQLTNGVHR